MIGWSLKSCSYRLACGGIVLGFLQFVVGFGLPAWKRDARVISGLWQNCTASLSKCESYSTHSGEGWFDAVRAVEAVALVNYCICLVILCELNCTSRNIHAVRCDRFGLPALCVCTGVLGLAGGVVYAVCEADGHSTFSSGLYLVLVGSTFGLLCGVFLLCHKPKLYEDELDLDSIRSAPVFSSTINPVFVEPSPLRAAETEVFY
ncbi:uncharacterized protein LOC124132614 [Haliotis rufescens]|uniref:uncharacterized protein LOC124132614 n=1 Tax=Haliotis rufescens TaxID=6454 RepID=UPI00201E951B|nr:uncharacterized protein LOC124132614 [Haliotis rufescens]